MPWARFDERFPGHRRIRRLSDAAFRLHVSAVCWSCEYLTDGHIPPHDLSEVSDVRRPEKVADELVAAGRWHLPGFICPSEHCDPVDDGWRIHDFLDYNPSRSEVEEKREKDAERKRRGRTSDKRRTPKGVRTESARTHDGVLAESARTDPVVTNVTTTRPDPVPTSSADLTDTQRSKSITDAYAAAEPMCKWPAVNGVVLKAIRSERFTDDEIRAGLLRLASEGRSVTVETLRIELAGQPPPSRPNRAEERTRSGLALVAKLEAEERQQGEIA